MIRWFVCAFLALAGAGVAQERAVYSVVVDFDWMADNGTPENPHWSRLIAFSHSSRYSLFKDGDTASSGLALVATNGRVSVLEAELNEGQRRGRVGDFLVLPGIGTGDGSFEFDIELSEKHSRVSFATMLAPSPDWFSGASGLALFQNDAWVQSLSVPIWAWDAGADNGEDFSSANAPTQPRQSVRLLTHPAFLRDTGMTPIGWVKISRKN